jgi:ribosomal protein L11 methyltransferase
MPAKPSSADASTVARLPLAEAPARALADQLAEIFDPSEVVVSCEEAAGHWTVSIHFHAPPNETAVRAVVALAAGADAANALAFERIAARDWIKAGLDALTPVQAGRFVVHGAHDRARVPVNRIGIEIEAALAFGTGHHGTTRGCLLALDRIIKARKLDTARILDLGTGSGVLAIAAARALHRCVLASDIDPRAVRAARGNARLNRAGALIAVMQTSGLGAHRFRIRAPFDLAFANILLAPLKRFASPLARLLAPDARVVLSGLLPAHANAALSAYRAQGLALERRIELDGWVTLVLKRSSQHPHARADIARRHRAP